jgi:2-isopropylmalate synthase
VLRRSETYEHIHPELVGNERRLLVSRQAGASIISQKARELRLRIPKDSPEAREIVRRVKAMEHEGYEFESAEASLALLMKSLRGKRRRPFRLEGFRVIVEKKGDQPALSEATIMLTVRGEKEHTAAEGDGPVHALDQALRKALEPFYPELSRVQLTDFKVRVIEAKEGTAGKVRVLIQSSDGTESWGTVGLDTNIIQASWDALVDSVEYALIHKRR